MLSLRMQVKVLSMSGLRGARGMAQLVVKIPLQPAEEVGAKAKKGRLLQDELLNDGTERHAVKLTEDDIGATMQFLQLKALCVVPISFAATIPPSHHHRQPKPPLVEISDAEAPS